MKSLYERGYGREDILELFRFIDWMMVLPEALKDQFEHDLFAYEQEKHMPYVTSIERSGIEKGMQQGIQQGIERGLQQGIQQGETTLLRRQLTRRFGPLPDWAETRLAQASTDQCEEWADRLLDAKSLEGVLGPFG